MNTWFPPLHLFKHHHADLVKLCLHFYWNCLAISGLDGLFEVTGPKNSCNKLFRAVNAHENSRISLKVD